MTRAVHLAAYVWWLQAKVNRMKQWRTDLGYADMRYLLIYRVCPQQQFWRAATEGELVPQTGHRSSEGVSSTTLLVAQTSQHGWQQQWILGEREVSGNAVMLSACVFDPWHLSSRKYMTRPEHTSQHNICRTWPTLSGCWTPFLSTVALKHHVPGKNTYTLESKEACFFIAVWTTYWSFHIQWIYTLYA